MLKIDKFSSALHLELLLEWPSQMKCVLGEQSTYGNNNLQLLEMNDQRRSPLDDERRAKIAKMDQSVKWLAIENWREFIWFWYGIWNRLRLFNERRRLRKYKLEMVILENFYVYDFEEIFARQ